LSGQIESLTALARGLTAHGHAVRIVTAFDEDLLRGEDTPPVEQEVGASAGGKLASILKSTARLARVGGSADLIHLNLPTPAFSLVADLLRLRLRGGPPIIVGYEAQLAEVRRLLRGDYLRRAWRFYLPLLLVNNAILGRLAPYGCARYVTATEYQRAELQRLGVEAARLVVLPNLIDTAKLRRVPQAVARRELPGVGEAGPLIGWCGHYHDVKGVDTLLEAFARLSRARPAARLALAWSGIGDARPVEARVRALALTDRVVRLGRVDVGQFLSTLDVLALPYRLTLGQGAYPNLVLEAMQIGVPLVTSDLPLLRELVEHGSTALLGPPDDAAVLAVQVARLLDEPDLVAGMIQRQHALMAGALSPERLTASYEWLYEQVLANRT
jgi:glycosyltransferase involved in cell wall biosynthesis